METGTVKYTSQDMIHVERFFMVNRYDAIEFICIEKRFFRPHSVMFVFSKMILHTKVSND